MQRSQNFDTNLSRLEEMGWLDLGQFSSRGKIQHSRDTNYDTGTNYFTYGLIYQSFHTNAVCYGNIIMDIVLLLVSNL